MGVINAVKDLFSPGHASLTVNINISVSTTEELKEILDALDDYEDMEDHAHTPDPKLPDAPPEDEGPTPEPVFHFEIDETVKSSDKASVFGDESDKKKHFIGETKVAFVFDGDVVELADWNEALGGFYPHLNPPFLEPVPITKYWRVKLLRDKSGNPLSSVVGWVKNQKGVFLMSDIPDGS